jgi:hypothetical protein
LEALLEARDRSRALPRRLTAPGRRRAAQPRRFAFDSVLCRTTSACGDSSMPPTSRRCWRRQPIAAWRSDDCRCAPPLAGQDAPLQLVRTAARRRRSPAPLMSWRGRPLPQQLQRRDHPAPS